MEKGIAELCDLLYEGTESIFAACAARLRDKMLLDEEPSDGAKAAMVRLGCERLKASLKFIFDNEFDKLELYVMRNVLHFPNEAPSHSSEIPLDQPRHRDTIPDEALVDAEIEALARELGRATQENEALKLRIASAQGHLDRLRPLIEGPPDIIERAETAALHFPDFTRDIEELTQAATDLSRQLSGQETSVSPPPEHNNPPPSSAS